PARCRTLLQIPNTLPTVLAGPQKLVYTFRLSRNLIRRRASWPLNDLAEHFRLQGIDLQRHYLTPSSGPLLHRCFISRQSSRFGLMTKTGIASRPRRLSPKPATNRRSLSPTRRLVSGRNNTVSSMGLTSSTYWTR